MTKAKEYVIGRKRTLHDGSVIYTEFPDVREAIGKAGDFDATEAVTWCSDPHNYSVMRFKSSQRREALKLFATWPKVFERCELVALDQLPVMEEVQ
jgi:hypothetical protein